MTTDRVQSFPLSRFELLWACVAAAALFCFHLATANWFPLEWCDEVLLTDAGVNWHLGKGFVSTSWPDQGSWEFFSGNLPLFPAFVCGWLNLWGFSELTWRAVASFSSSVGALLLYITVRKEGWVKRPLTAFLFLTIFLMNGLGMQLMRGMRYDGFHLLLLALTLWVWMSRKTRVRLVLLVSLGALLVSSGIQVAFYAGLLSLLSFYFERKKALPSIAALGSGILLGAGIIVLLWWSHDALAGFLGNVALTRQLEHEQGTWLRTFLFRIFVQPLHSNVLPYLVMMYLAAAWPLLQKRAWLPLVALFLLAVSLQVGIHFRVYYYWYVVGPLALATAISLDAPKSYGRLRASIAGAAFALVMVNGPLKLLLYSWALNIPARQEAIRQFAAQHLTASDVLVSEYIAYTSVKPVVQQAYFPHYFARMPASEAQAVSAVLMQPHGRGLEIGNSPIDTTEWMQRSGASWKLVADVPAPPPKDFWYMLERWFPHSCQRFAAKNDLFRLSLYRK